MIRECNNMYGAYRDTCKHFGLYSVQNDFFYIINHRPTIVCKSLGLSRDSRVLSKLSLFIFPIKPCCVILEL